MTPLNLMSAPAMDASGGHQVLAPATGELDLDLTAGQFDQLVEKMVGDTGEAIDDSQRLNMLRDAIEELDSSEILGFLAMLENQSGWQADKGSILNVADISTAAGKLADNALISEPGAQQPRLNQHTGVYQSLIPDSPQGAEILQQALSGALDEATENYLPAGRGDDQAAAELALVQDNDLLPVPGEAAVRHEAEVLKIDSSAARSETLLSLSPAETVQTGLDFSVQNPAALPAGGKSHAALQENSQNPVVDSRLLPNVQDERWGDALGQRLAMLVSGQRQEAVMRLDPPELGTLGVRLVVENGSVSVQFSSAVPQVREMLEAEADRLRVAIEGEGLELADVNVGQGGEGSRQQESPHYAENWQETGFDVEREPDAMNSQWSVADVHIPLNHGLISTYA